MSWTQTLRGRWERGPTLILEQHVVPGVMTTKLDLQVGDVFYELIERHRWVGDFRTRAEAETAADGGER